MTNTTNNKDREADLKKGKDDDYEFLIENNVRFSIISCLSIFQEPLNLSKIAKLTGHPITSLIHHIPQILERGLIKVEKIPGRRGKFYNVTRKFIEEQDLRSKEMGEEFSNELLEEKKTLSNSEYKKESFFEIKKKLGSKELFTNMIDLIRSLGVFNNNIAKISSEYYYYLLKNISQEYSDELKIALADVMVNQDSVSISNVSQLLELQKLFLDFFNGLTEIKKKFDHENEKIRKKELEKVYVYFFTTPIVDITEDI